MFHVFLGSYLDVESLNEGISIQRNKQNLSPLQNAFNTHLIHSTVQEHFSGYKFGTR